MMADTAVCYPRVDERRLAQTPARLVFLLQRRRRRRLIETRVRLSPKLVTDSAC